MIKNYIYNSSKMIGGKKVIYLDNSATTYPKPSSVLNSLNISYRKYAANPGRSGHTMSKNTGQEIEKSRKAVANFFGLENSSNVSFTLNCTQAINFVIKGLLKKGDHVVISSIEHNAVMRPLKKLEKSGIITYSVAKVYPGNFEKTLDSFRKSINANTTLIVCSHASNVWGIRLPIEKICALAKIYDIPVLVDAAQSAGLLPIDIRKIGIDYLCVAGHKALYGPMGTGILITEKSENLDTIIEGGTGTNSMTFCQPRNMPQKFESGTPNTAGIIAIKPAIEFVNRMGISNILNHESKLINYLYDELKNIKHIELYMPKPNPNFFVPVLSFNVRGYISDEIGEILNFYGIEVRTGLHCAPAAHESMNTLKRGTVRVSLSVFNTINDINMLLKVLKKIKPKI